MPLITLFVAILLAMPGTLLAQHEEHCTRAHQYLTDVVGMAAVTEPDTLDDWRTGALVPGCRVTAAGTTTRSLGAEARSFYQLLREAGWTRTPDPRDAPNEASLRFRTEGSDCLFNFYSGGLLGTEAEGLVDDARVPGPGERRYNFLVLCMPARDATPRPNGPLSD